MVRYGEKSPIFKQSEPEEPNDWQFENPIIAVDLDTGRVVKSNYLKEGFSMAKPRKRTEEVREMLPIELADVEPVETGVPELEPEHKCNCSKDTLMIEELADLREEVERLKKIATATQAFAYKHRHQIGPGHYSEWGVAD